MRRWSSRRSWEVDLRNDIGHLPAGNYMRIRAVGSVAAIRGT